MPDQRKHRGPHPKDENLFGKSQIPLLQEAIADLYWLLSKGYPDNASLKIVGDKFKLKSRQRLALQRSVCNQSEAIKRSEKLVLPSQLSGQSVEIDAFNLLITIESAFSGGVIFKGLDGCYRDMASIHGTYKRVIETETALIKIGETLSSLGVTSVHWLLDKPVSNSGRMKTLLYTIAEKHKFLWTAELYFNPDAELVQSSQIAVTSDSMILDNCKKWFNLANYLIDQEIPQARLIRFRLP